MTFEQQLQEFRSHHARNIDQAMALRGQRIVCFGAGATGSHVASLLAQAGLNVDVIDRDLMDRANLMRHHLTDPRAVGQPKAHALARRIRSETPAIQSIRGVKGDIELLTDGELQTLMRAAALVLGCTGRDAIDRRLNRVARELGVPLIVPSLWADGQDQVLGDLQIVAWHLPRRIGGCFECLRPARAAEPPAAEAQRGFGAEVLRVATLTAEVSLGLLLPDSAQHAPLMRQLARGGNYFVIPRWPPSLRAVITKRRVSCPTCTDGLRVAPTRTGSSEAALRDWTIGGLLASTLLWHALIPGLDAAATIALVGLAGLWWRNRLPTFATVASRTRRIFDGRF